MSFDIVVQTGGYWTLLYHSQPSYADGVPIVFTYSSLDNSHVYGTDVAIYTTSPTCSGGYNFASIPDF